MKLPKLKKEEMPVDEKGWYNYKRKMWDLKHPKGKSHLIEMSQKQYDKIFGKTPRKNKVDSS